MAVIGLALGLTSCMRTAEEKSAAWVRSAKTSIQRKNYDGAVHDLLNAIQTTPKMAEAHYLLGEALLQSGHPARAVRSFLAAADLEPTRTDAHLKIAEILNEMGDNTLLPQAKDHAHRAWEQRPNDPDALHTLAVSELRMGETKAAVGHLEQALGIAPGHAKSSETLAQVQLSVDKNAGSAEQTLRRALEHSLKPTEALVALGKFYVVTGHAAAAETQYRAAIAADPNNGPALMELARLKQRTGNLAETEQTLRRLSSLPDKAYRPLHALFLLQNGRQGEAITELKKEWSSDPSNTEVRGRLVDAYFLTNQLSDAEKLLSVVLAKDAGDSAALEQQGKLYLRKGRFQDAERSLTQALRLRPESAPASYALAQAHRNQGHTQESVQAFRRALESDPAMLQARIELSESLRNSHSLRDALVVLDSAPASQKEQLPFLTERGWVLLALGRYAEAKPGAMRALAMARTPATLVQSGLVELQDKRYDAARTLLEEAVKTAPANVEALNAIAYSLASENKVTAATERIRKQAALLPQSAEVQLLLGHWQEQAGELAAAGTAYAAAAAADPANVPAVLAAARIDMLQGRWESARSRVQGILTKEPRNVNALLGLGMIEEGTGRNQAAIQVYRSLLQIDSSHYVAKNNLAALLGENPAGLEEALLLARDAKRGLPESPEIDDTLGWIYCRKGLYSNAIQHLEDAAHRMRGARVHYHLAIAYLGAGDRNRGLKALATARKMDPGLPEAAQAEQMAARTQ
jgi:tetratricopeptide (TPR) repeat protein